MINNSNFRVWNPAIGTYLNLTFLKILLISNSVNNVSDHGLKRLLGYVISIHKSERVVKLRLVYVGMIWND